MKVTTERTPDCNAIVTVEVDETQVAGAMKTAAQRISRVRPIPGFRPGKAPYERVERAVGKDLLRDEAIDELAQSVYKQVIQDEKIDVYDAGKLDIVQKEPLILKYTIPTRPVVTLGDYRSIHMQPQPVEATDDEVNQIIERLRQDQATMAPVTRAVALGDLATINLKGGIEGQPPFEREGMQVRVQKEQGTFPWIEQLVGTNVNEPRAITYVYPDDTPNKEIAGKTATYDVTVTDVKEMQLAALDDEFAKSVSSFETLDQLKGRIRTNVLAEKQAEENNRFADQLVDAVVDQSQVAFPASMIEDETELELGRSKEIAQQIGLTWDKYLQLSGKDENGFRETARPRAEKRIKRLLTLMELAEAEKIEVNNKEVDVEIDHRAMEAAQSGGRADQTRRALSSRESRRDIEFSLRMGKAIERLVAIAKGEPTSGKILTPEMVLEEERARAQAAASGNVPSGSPSGLITDPSQISSENWPRGLDRPLIPGQDR